MPSKSLQTPIKNKRKKIIFILKFTPLILLAIVALGYVTLNYIIDKDNIDIFYQTDQSEAAFIFFFLLFFIPFSYGSACLMARRWIPIDFKSLCMYMGIMYFCACSLEIVVSSMFEAAINRPSWTYHVWPVHGGSTSGVKFLIYPWYGFHYYLIHKVVEFKKSPALDNLWMKGLVMPLDAMTMETCVNIFTLICFNSYYFYYLSPELYHFTSIEIFIPYYICGIISLTIVYYLDRKEMPRIWIGAAAYVSALILIFGVT